MWSVVKRLPPSLHPTNHFHHLKDKQTRKSSAASSNAERDTHSMASTITDSSLQSLQAAHVKSLCRYKNKYGPPVKNTGKYSMISPQTPTSQTSLGLECYETPRASVWGKRDLLVTRLRRPPGIYAVLGQPVTCAPGRQPQISYFSHTLHETLRFQYLLLTAISSCSRFRQKRKN